MQSNTACIVGPKTETAALLWYANSSYLCYY